MQTGASRMAYQVPCFGFRGAKHALKGYKNTPDGIEMAAKTSSSAYCR